MFGRGTIKRMSSGRLFEASSGPIRDEVVPEENLNCAYKCSGCNRRFSHPPALTTHQKFCEKYQDLFSWHLGLEEDSEEERQSDEDVNTTDADNCTSLNTSVDDAQHSSSFDTPGGGSREASGKMRKDGKPKESGLAEGARRGNYSVLFKYEVLQDYRLNQQKKSAGLLSDPMFRTCQTFNVHKSLISKWSKQGDEIKSAITHGGANKSRQLKNRVGQPLDRQSRFARRMTLHAGRGVMFPLAESSLHTAYKAHRAKGRKVNNRWLAINMRKFVRQLYGEDPANNFKASYGWQQALLDRLGISSRRGSNNKCDHVMQRLPRIKRWHARWRRRLKSGPTYKLHPKWGRWLPRNRLSVDQVPCNLREGGKVTFEDKGSTRVWIAGAKADDGKRICTLQIVARAHNGSSDMPRHGQPKVGIIFRGQGLRVSEAERESWHPDVHVRFQPKAWADTLYCEAHAGHEMAEATYDARVKNEESIVHYDNLHGQTTEDHKTILLTKAKAYRHLLPAGVTSEIQLIDDGVGYALKREMGHLLDRWLEDDINMEKWTNSDGQKMAMWEKRVLLTNLAGEAWEAICSRFDFEKAATRIGLRMTIDGSDDNLIRIQGVDDYHFSEADAGTPGEIGDGMDPTEQQESERLINIHSGPEDSSDEELPTGPLGSDVDLSDEDSELPPDSSDEEDDTDLVEDMIGPAQADPPIGFKYILTKPPMKTPDEGRAMVGRYIHHAWDAGKAIQGWFVGKITEFGVTNRRDLQKKPSANFVVSYDKNLTRNKTLHGRVASTLSVDRYGPGEWWLLLDETTTD